jgi:hypothetical protein
MTAAKKSGLWAALTAGRISSPPRKRLYCVGTSKSGTHSLAEMFAHGVRTEHEAEAEEVIRKVLGASNGDISRKEMIRWVHARDERLALEVDSSQLNFFLLDILAQEFPEARFVLTIRDAYSWLDSLFNHLLRYTQTSPDWVRMREFRFHSATFTHAPEEQVLKQNGLHTLDGYLSYWAKHNGQVVERVPRERLLVVRTDQIRQRAVEICDFARFPRSAVELDRSHAFKNTEKINLIRQLNQVFLEQKIEFYCRPLMTRFFPEIKSLEDAKL